MSKIRMEYGTEEQRQKKHEKSILREEIASHTKEFLANGGTIAVIPRGVSAIVISKKTRI